MNRGWIKLYRKIWDHEFYREIRKFSRYEAWLDLIMIANHSDNKFLLGNETVEVKRGSFITSELKLMERWRWSKSKVRAFLKLLEKNQMIVKKTDHKKTTIFLVNYDLYQDSGTTKEPQKDRQETAKRPQKDTNKNEKHEKNVENDKNNILSVEFEKEFETWWDGYPKKRGKAEARNAWIKLRQEGKTVEQLTQCQERYRQEIRHHGTEDKFIMSGSTFLNGRWEDYVVKPRIPRPWEMKTL